MRLPRHILNRLYRCSKQPCMRNCNVTLHSRGAVGECDQGLASIMLEIEKTLNLHFTNRLQRARLCFFSQALSPEAHGTCIIPLARPNPNLPARPFCQTRRRGKCNNASGVRLHSRHALAASHLLAAPPPVAALRRAAIVWGSWVSAASLVLSEMVAIQTVGPPVVGLAILLLPLFGADLAEIKKACSLQQPLNFGPSLSSADTELMLDTACLHGMHPRRHT